MPKKKGPKAARARFRNTTPLSSQFLRRLLSWVIREEELPKHWLRQIWFRNVQHRHSGVAYHNGRVVVSTGPEERFREYRAHPLSDPEAPQDRIEALVLLTAHELFHVRQFATGTLRNKDGSRNRDAENAAELAGRRVLKVFRERREELSALWGPQVPAAKPARLRPALKQRNCDRCHANLERWKQRHELARWRAEQAEKDAARTLAKVREYERKLARYGREGVRPTGCEREDSSPPRV